MEEKNTALLDEGAKTEEAALTLQEQRIAKREAANKAKKRKIRRKRIITLAIVAAVVGLIVYGMYSLFHEEEAEKTVWSEVVYRGSITSTITGSGETRALSSATLTLTSGGEVREVFVQQGDFVNEGDPLYTVDSTEAEKEVKDAEKAVADVQKQIDDLGKAYVDLTVTAPFAGKLIDAPDLKTGEDISAGTSLGTLVDDKTMKLSLYFSYAYENEFSVGKTATISIPATMENVTGKVENINKVNRISPEGSKLFEVVFSLTNPGTLTADMGATAFLTTSGGEEIFAYEAGLLQYNRTQDITTKTSGELASVNLLNYGEVYAGQLLVQLKGDSNADQLQTLNDSMEAAQEKLAKAKEALENYNAVSPITGTVLSVSLIPGETVEANRAAVSIANTSVMLVKANIDSMNISYVQPGMYCDIIQYSMTGEQIPMSGVVESVSMEAESENGLSSFPATIRVDNYDNSLRQGMYVEYSMMAAQSEDCLLVPLQAVKQSALGTCVFVAAESAPENALPTEELGLEVPEGFYAVPVSVGLADQSSVEILDGVEEGQEVFVQFMTNSGDSWSMGGGMVYYG